MLLAKIECEKISVEKLAELLFVYSKKLNVCFTIRKYMHASLLTHFHSLKA